MNRYAGYDLKTDFYDLTEKQQHRLYAASVYAVGRYSLMDISKLSKVPKTTIWRFIVNDLKGISPSMHSKCLEHFQNHKCNGGLTIMERERRKNIKKEEFKEC